MLRSADRHGTASSSNPSRIIVSMPRKTVAASAAISSGVNGPRPPKRAATLAAVSASRSNQPVRLARTASAISLVRPAGGRHLLQHADVAGPQIVLEEVAGLLPLPPQRHLGAVEAS